MPSEEVHSRPDVVLDLAKEAAAQRDWGLLAELTSDILETYPGNNEAWRLKRMSDDVQGWQVVANDRRWQLLLDLTTEALKHDPEHMGALSYQWVAQREFIDRDMFQQLGLDPDSWMGDRRTKRKSYLWPGLLSLFVLSLIVASIFWVVSNPSVVKEIPFPSPEGADIWILAGGIVVLLVSATFASYLQIFFTSSFEIAKPAKIAALAVMLAGLAMLFAAIGWWGSAGILGAWVWLAISMAYWEKRYEMYLKSGVNPYRTFRDH